MVDVNIILVVGVFNFQTAILSKHTLFTAIIKASGIKVYAPEDLQNLPPYTFHRITIL